MTASESVVRRDIPEPSAPDDAVWGSYAIADKSAGRAICKMLSALFIYTLLAMSCAATWTYFAILGH